MSNNFSRFFRVTEVRHLANKITCRLHRAIFLIRNPTLAFAILYNSDKYPRDELLSLCWAFLPFFAVFRLSQLVLVNTGGGRTENATNRSHQASLIRKLLYLSVQFKFVIFIYLLLSGLPILEVVLSIPLRTFRFRFSWPRFAPQLVWTWNSTGKKEVKYFYVCSSNLNSCVIFLLFYDFATFYTRVSRCVVLSSAFYLTCDQAFYS